MKIIKITIFCISLLLLQNSMAQRNVIWVHGLYEDEHFWTHYNQIFDNELAEFTNSSSYKGDFSTSSITNGAYDLMYKMTNYYGYTNSNNYRNIGIGHSMGGLMIRETDRLRDGTSKKFGGYITVCTPNYGAPIANTLLEINLDDLANDACNTLNAGPTSEFAPVDFGIDLSINHLCNYSIDLANINKYIPDSTILENLKEGSSAINAINNYTNNNNPNIPRISIWANENSPVHWRLLSTTMYPNDPDSKLVNKVNIIRASYNAHYLIHRSAAVFYITIFGTSFSILNPLAGYKAAQWKKGRDWIDNSENQWNGLIKTTKRIPQTYWVEVWEPCSPIGVGAIDEDYMGRPVAPDPDCGEWVWRQRTRYISVNYPSDGLLPQYTQELQGIPYNNKYEVDGANHLEVGNMTIDGNGVDETREVLRDIFSRPPSDFFRTN